MMARYIDADKIDYKVTMVGMDEYAGYRAVAFESEIDEMPTADVVEVVRCKDCANYDSKYRLCRLLHDDPIEMDGGDFCSYGKPINITKDKMEE